MPVVKVKFFATVREVTGTRMIEMEADTIRNVLDKLVLKYGPRFVETVMDGDSGKLKQFYSCMVNGKKIELLDGYETHLQEGDAVALFPPVGGG